MYALSCREAKKLIPVKMSHYQAVSAFIPGPRKGSWEPVGPSGINYCARRRQADVYSRLPGG
jgi:hypothetical protein